MCETAKLPDGRVIRVVGYDWYRSPAAELRGWLVMLGLAAMLWGCGGLAFSPGVEQAVGSDGAPDAPDAGEGGLHDAPPDGGSDTDGRPEAADAQTCDRQAPNAQCGQIPPDACSLFVHNDGLGQQWTDCAPLGTYDESEAENACRAAAAAGGGDPASCTPRSCGDAGIEDVCGAVGATFGCSCWGFAGPGAGHVLSNCECARATDWSWQ